MVPLAGIDAKTLLEHSARSTEGSQAKASGFAAGKILKTGFWSQSTTFEKYYRKSILEDGCKFK